jgi:hypothetical protein
MQHVSQGDNTEIVNPSPSANERTKQGLLTAALRTAGNAITIKADSCTRNFIMMYVVL